MHRISILERSVGQAFTQPSSHVCRSCRLRVGGPQRRQIQSSTQLRAETSTGVAKAQTLDSDVALENNAADDVELLPEGWAESAEVDPNYIEATTWDELERIGSESWVEGQLDNHDRYKGWSKVKPSRTFPKSRVPEVLLPLVRIAVANTKHSERSPLGKEKWWQYKVSNPALKFEIARLLLQRTGIKVPDFTLTCAETLADFQEILVTKPEPKKLAQTLQGTQQIGELPNVQVHSKRVGPIDKEKAVGRWKIIEQELINRGLPVSGRAERDARAKAKKLAAKEAVVTEVD